MRRGGMGGESEREGWEDTLSRLCDILPRKTGGEGSGVGKS
jgi:hypothetical protein